MYDPLHAQLHPFYAVPSLSFGLWVCLLACCLHSACLIHQHPILPSTPFHHHSSTPVSPAEKTWIQGGWILALLCESWTYYSFSLLSTNSPPINLPPLNTTLPPPTASSTMPHPTPTPTKPSTPLPWLSGPAPTPASCPDRSRAVWLATRLGLETHPTFSANPPESDRKRWKDKQFLVRASCFLQSHPSHAPHPTIIEVDRHASRLD
jgi:hypothetical protein